MASIYGRGEWTCVAAEVLENIPSDENQSQNLTWLLFPGANPSFENAPRIAACPALNSGRDSRRASRSWNQQFLAYVYARRTRTDADIAKVLTMG